MAASSGGPAPKVAASREDLARVIIVQPWRLNNTALKWIRDTHENPRGCPTIDFVDLTLKDPLQIGVLENQGGMDYWFKKNETQPWSWQQMLGAMQPDVKEKVLGEAGQGVARISCAPIHGSYDHKRRHAARLG